MYALPYIFGCQLSSPPRSRPTFCSNRREIFCALASPPSLTLPHNRGEGGGDEPSSIMRGVAFNPFGLVDCGYDAAASPRATANEAIALW